jgi:hypothetical protein
MSLARHALDRHYSIWRCLQPAARSVIRARYVDIHVKPFLQLRNIAGIIPKR